MQDFYALLLLLVIVCWGALPAILLKPIAERRKVDFLLGFVMVFFLGWLGLFIIWMQPIKAEPRARRFTKTMRKR